MNINILKLIISNLYSYRYFIYTNVKREIQLSHSNTIIGFSWQLINPLIMILIYTIIFSTALKGYLNKNNSIYDYSLFVCIGMIHWNFFTDLTNKLVNIFIASDNIIKKINFPILALPIIKIIVSSFNYMIFIFILIVVFSCYGNFSFNKILFLIPVVLIQIFFSLGLGLLLGVVNVFLRDTSHVFNIVQQFWFWITPIVYPISVLPENIKFLVIFNPLSIIFQSYSDILIFSKFPNITPLIIIFLISILLNFIAIRLIILKRGEIIDEL